ncbi:cobyrinic acid a,c-diamide synthase [Acetitomaculum ruminis DSM 5522]|uniref:Cobyrinate a,c-diamide synthase n=1 Tax=Acetitomaculum ruminis DSM 5522 TaxID=1120918 RepID=A0A1I0WVM1_9FIRM|nr:cobyrinate a,c-diamide synthase [Acetitomaculum ruminis]SFA92614.1 cobyrinic acid a,c-diamide synthase [Acetitomaculum ruminis DSM 5522]
MAESRFMLAAPSSGSGKTLITCGLLQALVNRKMKIASFKCGPDYIDPMFHSKVIGAKSRNLDTFFTGKEVTKYLFKKNAKDCDISVIEGVMGFYDGMGLKSHEGSAYDLSLTLDAPVILVVDTKGMSLSILALIKGFLDYKKDNKIKGVILNRLPKSLYPSIKEKIENELGIKAFGYVPSVPDLVIESRHLGLVTPDEISDLSEKLNELSKILEETVEIDEIIELAKKAPDLDAKEVTLKKLPEDEKPVIAVARDEAFCFYYADNIEAFEKMGAKIVEFSPLHDAHLPDCDGLLLGGGYPELAAKELSQNKSMLNEIKNKIENGLPFLAECGGFMYLHDFMEGMDGISYNMAGIIKGKAFRTQKLNRFGYVELVSKEDNVLAKKGEKIKAHEFHYFDSDCNGDGFIAKKPNRNKEWDCINVSDTFAAGFPHLYYYSNPDFAFSFVKKCSHYKKER